MKLTKYRLNKILQTNEKQTRKKKHNNNNKLLTHNISRRRKSQFNIRSTTLKHY